MQRSHSTHRLLRNRIGWRQRLARLQGSPVTFDLAAYDEPLAEIERFGADIERLSDGDIEARARDLRQRAGASLEPIRAEFFALVREASHRVLGLRPFDVQVLAAIALDAGHIVEMQTGEGKTLAAVMPAALNALAREGRACPDVQRLPGAARRRMDGARCTGCWACLSGSSNRAWHGRNASAPTAPTSRMSRPRKRDSIISAICWPRIRVELVHRPFHFALVDEADSLLIDEARVPLVIAGSIGRELARAPRLAALVASLTPGVHFDSDEYGRDVELTDAGIEQAERALGVGSLHGADNYRLLTELNCALHAHVLLRRDVDYIVRDGRIAVVDELTGRVVVDRHWPDGLQAALEAKEGLERQADGQILGIDHPAALSARLPSPVRHDRHGADRRRGTAFELYGRAVVVVPTHRPMIRVDRPDIVFTHRDAKERAVVDEIRRAHATGRPVLVGTLTVEESERLAARLRDAGVDLPGAEREERRDGSVGSSPAPERVARSRSPRTWPAAAPTSGSAARRARAVRRSAACM